MQKNILVTGGAGYIGSHTVKNLMQNGYNCIVLDNLIYGHQEAVSTPHFIKAELKDKAALHDIFTKWKIDAVIHFAAYGYVGESVSNPQKYYQNNVGQTLVLLENMLEHDIKNIIFSSTCATYGQPEYTPIDEQHRQSPINPYGQTKLMIETIFADYEKAYGLNHISLRYFNAAGAAKDGSLGESHTPETHLIPLVFQAIQGKRDFLSIYGTDYDTPDGTCLRDYIHVEDLAEAHRLALEKINTYSGYLNLGTGVPTSVREIITAAEKVSGKSCPIKEAPRRPGDPARLFAALQKAKDILGWEVRYTKIEDILQTAWNWEENRRF